ncbi:MAG: hypothetical protein ACI9QC_000632 [Oceanicoccus sp.]|jgi:hypothetical protein
MKLSDDTNIIESKLKDLELAMTQWLTALYVYLQTPKQAYTQVSTLSEIKSSESLQNLSALGSLEFERLLTRSLESIGRGDRKMFKELCEFLLSELPKAAHGVIRAIYSQIVSDEVLESLRTTFREDSRKV